MYTGEWGENNFHPNNSDKKKSIFKEVELRDRDS